MRLFIALDPGKKLRDQLSGIQEDLKNQGIRGSWSRMENLHMTLVFLGECTASQKQAAQAVLEKLPCPETILPCTGLGHFGSLWYLGFQADPALEDYVRQLKACLQEAGVSFDAKPFKAHVTLIRKASAIPVLSDTQTASLVFAAGRPVLYESRQIQGTLTYLAVSRNSR